MSVYEEWSLYNINVNMRLYIYIMSSHNQFSENMSHLTNVIKYLNIYPTAIHFDINLLEEMVCLMLCQKKSHSLKYFDAYCAASL